MSALLNMMVADNPEVAIVSTAANYGPMIACLMTAMIIFIIAIIVVMAESNKIPGILLMVLAAILGAEGMYLMYKVYKKKKSN